VQHVHARRALRYGWMPLLALAATQTLEAGERLSLAQAVDGIQAEFGVSDSAVGFLPYAMALIGAPGSVPFGLLADRGRRTRLLGIAMAIWTVTMGLNGLATSFAVLFLFRMGVGMVEANSPAAYSLLADYYPMKDRARFMGLYQSGALLGALLGLTLGGIAVELGGWRWAFWIWIPFGIATTVFVLRQPDPARGHQDADFESDLALTIPGGSDVTDMANLTGLLPEPIRQPTLDYSRATLRQVGRELLHIRSMWFGVLALTISSLLLSGLQFWAVEYFKRVHGLNAAGAGALTGTLGLGAAAGILVGGVVADRYLRRGVLCARVYVVSLGSIGAALLLLPAMYSTNLAITAPLFVVGGFLLTMPIAPAEALVSDVVVFELRGRAASVRSWVRSIGQAGAPLIGLLSDLFINRGMSEADGLRIAIVAFIPLYAVGGVVMLLAARTYPADLAFVVSESRRRRESGAP
jgi:MFS family permease